MQIYLNLILLYKKYSAGATIFQDSVRSLASAVAPGKSKMLSECVNHDGFELRFKHIRRITSSRRDRGSLSALTERDVNDDVSEGLWHWRCGTACKLRNY